jgi:predicted SnoaL-like aldol condensation-catalyzing enzyme
MRKTAKVPRSHRDHAKKIIGSRASRERACRDERYGAASAGESGTPVHNIQSRDGSQQKIAMGFFSAVGPDRVALADPSYKQVNPIFVKLGVADKLNDYEEFKKTFLSQTAAPPPPVSSVRPPQGNPLEVVTAECDMVTVVHKLYRQDPTEPPGTYYEVFTFDTFRLRNGKLVEHWDFATIAPPSP